MPQSMAFLNYQGSAPFKTSSGRHMVRRGWAQAVEISSAGVASQLLSKADSCWKIIFDWYPLVMTNIAMGNGP